MQAIVIAFGLDERTVRSWLLKTGKQCQEIHEHLVENHKQELGQIQADEIENLFIRVKKMALCRPMVFAVDGFKGYPTVIKKIFRVAIPTGKRGRPPLQAWPNINIVRVIKRRVEKKLQIERSVFQGETDQVMPIIHESQADKGGINTSYIERLNATFRERISALARRSRNLYKQQLHTS